MECKRFGKGSIYEDMDCMLCNKCFECNSIAKEEETKAKIAAAHEECKGCNRISDCKRYKHGVRCCSFHCDLAFDMLTGKCDTCPCLSVCIKKHCKDVKYICTKDIEYKNIIEEFYKDEIYTFQIFENKVLYHDKILSFKDSNVFNKYFEAEKEEEF